ncbi:MAG: hypothetical protein K2J37_06905 [Ruminococcus sp.]|nr:hypothetical protein [Ruminococcus sp.]MDE6783973.1 hypothetical protein [Ruminococcus sp.]
MNPMAMLKLKPMFERFSQDHPKLLMFFAAAAGEVDKDSVLELTVKNSQGYTMKTNIKINDNDIEIFDELKKILNKGK